jgi:hypothetical protein
MARKDLPHPGIASVGEPDTVSSMVQPNAFPVPPSEPAWDITFTRLTRAVRPRVEAFVRDLARRFQAIGLGSDATFTQTPRGLSTFLALVGQRGLICIVDLTLVDGMAVGQGPCAALDIRLLDACGDVVADGLASGAQGCSFAENSANQALSSENLDRAVTAVYVATLAQFDLLGTVARHT